MYARNMNIRRCIDYIYYYPNQRVPDSGACGVYACNGNLLEWSELDADSDFDRTFGIVDTCTMDVADDVGVGLLHPSASFRLEEAALQ